MLLLFTRLKFVNSLPTTKIKTKLKAFADNKMNVNQKLKFDLGRVKKMWEKEKMLVTSFQKASISGSLKVQTVL